MRPSLENIEFIENYILGNFDPSEHEQARKRIEESPDLSHLLETQQCIYSATKRKALRSEIQSYAPATPSFFQHYRYWFAGGLAVLGIIGFLFINHLNKSPQEKQTSPLLQSQLAKNKEDVTPWIPFDVQTFSLIAEKGATLVGNDGTLIILGKSTLLDAAGNRVSGKVEAELIEALDWEDMIAYNLTTTSGGKALSSGGMMRIRYTQNGKEVYVDPQKPMHIEIPTDDYNPDMKVWEGEVKNGLLDWKNPQEIERYLTKIDLKYLDFIPTGFDAEVANLLPYKNHTKLSDKLVDSLYYSISVNRELYSIDRHSKNSFVNDCYFNIPKRKDMIGHLPLNQSKPLLKGANSVTAQIVDPEGNPIVGMEVTLRMDRYLEHEESVSTDENGYFTFSKFYPGEVSVYASLHSPDQGEILWKYCLETSFICPKSPKKYTLKKPLVAEFSSMINFKELSVSPKTGGRFIDPLSIKTIKTSRFQNTFIATQEFETRLQAMHSMKKGAVILETYVKNVSEPLWKCDEMAAKLLVGEEKEIFKAFAAQRLTNVQNDGIHQEALLEYYTNQRKAFRMEKRKNWKEIRSKTTKELLDLCQSVESALESPERLATLQAEANGRVPANSKMMQVSSRMGVTARNDGNGSYSFTWYSNSWCNIDRFLMDLGPTPYLTAVNTNKHEKDMKVYQCVRQLNNVIGLNNESGSYQALTSKNGYQGETFCMGMLMQGTQLLFDARSYIPSSDRMIDLNLEPTSPEDFYLELCSLAPEESDIAKRLRTEQGTLLTQAKIKETQAPLMREINMARNGISEDVVVYNRLFDVLSRIADPQQLQ